jgi:hypothetical protein
MKAMILIQSSTKTSQNVVACLTVVSYTFYNLRLRWIATQAEGMKRDPSMFMIRVTGIFAAW